MPSDTAPDRHFGFDIADMGIDPSPRFPAELLSETDETITQIWTYGEGEGLRASTIGEATRLANDNTLINWGATPQIREVKMDGTIVWDGFMSSSSFMGRIQAIDDLYDLYCPGCYSD